MHLTRSWCVDTVMNETFKISVGKLASLQRINIIKMANFGVLLE